MVYYYPDRTKFLQRGIDWLAAHPANWAQGKLGSDGSRCHCILGAAVRCSLRSSKFSAKTARTLIQSRMDANNLTAVEDQLARCNDDAKSLTEAIDRFVARANDVYGTNLVPRQPRRNITSRSLRPMASYADPVPCAKYGCKNKAHYTRPASLCSRHFQEWFNTSQDSNINQWLGVKSKSKETKRAK